MGVHDAFEDFYRLEHARVLASMTAVAGSLDLARDVTDEAFARAWDRWERVHDMAAAGGWVYRVALNVLRRRMRRAAMEQRLLSRQQPVVEVPPEARELWHLVRGLPERQRVAIVLRYVADLPEREIAAAMGVARGTVAATLAAARSRLAAMVTDDTQPCLEGLHD
jgi:RNA polymerase sigma factor (sigma-70 family)